MDLSSISISVLVIVIIWLTVLASIIVSKYRNRKDIQFHHTERRSNDRRESAKIDPLPEKDLESQHQRRKDDRRTKKNWKEDFLEIREQIEDELTPKDF